MNSGTSLRLTRVLLLCCCEENESLVKHRHSTGKRLRGLEAGAYFDKVLQFFVLLLQLFEDIDGLGVMAAELSVHLLHLLGVFV